MLKLENVGSQISKLRKEKGWTQMELADLMFVSFQAVSNWERGETMPDVSKLMQLADLFHISVDEILNNRRSSQVIMSAVNHEVVEDITFEEIEAVAPILKTEQVEHLYNTSQLDSIESLNVLAPFVSTGLIDSFAKKIYLESGLDGIVSIMPFMSDATLESLVTQSYEKNDLNCIEVTFPFLTCDFLEKIASEKYANEGLTGIMSMLPFLSDETIKSYFDEVIINGKINELQLIAPFVAETEIDILFKQKFIKL